MEIPLLICARVMEMEVEPAPGSVKMRCSECNEPIWVARSAPDMLHTGGPCKLLCMQCAAELSKDRSAQQQCDTPVSITLQRLQAQAEIAYDQMYNEPTDHAIRWQYELAVDCLLAAMKLARSNGLAELAEQMDKRREHIRQVYYRQFARPPKLLM